MAKINFTAARIEGYKCAAGKAQSFLWDGKTPSLRLRTTASGAKSDIFQSKIHGSTVRVTIDDPQSGTIDQVQEEARRLQTLSIAVLIPANTKPSGALLIRPAE